MTFICPGTIWFEIAEVPIIDQYLARRYQIFNEAWLPIYPGQKKFIFQNGPEFKINSIPLLKYFSVKPT